MHCATSPGADRVPPRVSEGSEPRRGRFRPNLSRTLGVTLVVTLILTTAHSQTNHNADLDRLRQEIAKLRARLGEVQSQAKSAQREMEAADLELGIRSRELDLAVDMQEKLEDEQHAVEKQVASLGPLIAQEKVYLGHRLVALYRMGGLSYVRMLLSIDQRRNPLEAMSMLSFLVSRDARAVTKFQSARQQLTQRLAELVERQKRVAEIRRLVEQRRMALQQARNEKQILLTSLQSESGQSEKRLAELEEKARRLERLVGLLSKRAQFSAPDDIRAVQGALSWPVQGKIVERFGKQRDPKFSTLTFNNGLKIAAAPGTEVHSVYQGTVLFSQWFKGYGNLIILDHGNRVFSLYGNLKSPAVAVGDKIAAGQAIAGVGESEDAQSGYLYFEIRQDNKPEDPQTWLR